jgi:hypothetical protein
MLSAADQTADLATQEARLKSFGLERILVEQASPSLARRSAFRRRQPRNVAFATHLNHALPSDIATQSALRTAVPEGGRLREVENS